MSDNGITVVHAECACRRGQMWSTFVAGEPRAVSGLTWSKGDGEWVYTVSVGVTRTVGGFEHQGDAHTASRHAAVALLEELDAVRARLVAAMEGE